MGQPDIKEIEAGLKDWDFVRNLPAAIGDYTLVPGSGIDGQILNIAAYVHEASHCRLDLTYTKETFDYVPVKTVGLHTFRDARACRIFWPAWTRKLYISCRMKQKRCTLSSGTTGARCLLR